MRDGEKNAGDSDVMPSPERDGRLPIFDRFATGASTLASKASFFAFCVLLVIVWVPSVLVLPSIDTWQLVINTATTIITFLLVALLQNTERRSDEAVQQKLNAIADALAGFMTEFSEDRPELRNRRQELVDAVGLEKRETSD